MNDKAKAIGDRFHRRAASYDTHGRVQRRMADLLMGSLAEGAARKAAAKPDILEIGCGTGALTEKLAAEWPNASITALDLAPAMIRLAERRVSVDRVRFIHTDAEVWSNDADAASFDLIVSNACFQWLVSPELTLQSLRSLLRDGGTLIFTTFGPATFHELHWAFTEAYSAWGLEPQRHGLSFATPARWVDWLENAGFADIRCERLIQAETYSSAKDFLHTVKAMGASATEAPGRGLGSRRLFADMYKRYEEKFASDEGVEATYELLLFRAAPAKRAKANADERPTVG